MRLVLRPARVSCCGPQDLSMSPGARLRAHSDASDAGLGEDDSDTGGRGCATPGWPVLSFMLTSADVRSVRVTLTDRGMLLSVADPVACGWGALTVWRPLVSLFDARNRAVGGKGLINETAEEETVSRAGRTRRPRQALHVRNACMGCTLRAVMLSVMTRRQCTMEARMYAWDGEAARARSLDVPRPPGCICFLPLIKLPQRTSY